MKEKKIIELAETGSDWEDILLHIITEEGMDPWDIDLVKLANIFAEEIKNLVKLDFKIPARLIIIAAILLRLKAEILDFEEEEIEIEIEDVEGIDISDVPLLEAPFIRKPIRKVTLDELIHSLKKAFHTQEIREEKKVRAHKKVEEVIGTEEDMETRINNLYLRINHVLKEIKNNEITFSSLVPKWERIEIVKSFLPLLHLSQDGKVSYRQEEYFKEIFIKLFS